MTEIIRNYGKTCLAVMICGMLLATFCYMQHADARGLREALGSQMKQQMDIAEPVLQSSAVLHVSKRRAVPMVRSHTLHTNKAYSVKDMLVVTDADGQEAFVRILDMEDRKDGTSVDKIITEEQQEMYMFSHSGVYRAKVELWDAQGATEYGHLYIRVED